MIAEAIGTLTPDRLVNRLSLFLSLLVVKALFVMLLIVFSEFALICRIALGDFQLHISTNSNLVR